MAPSPAPVPTMRLSLRLVRMLVVLTWAAAAGYLTLSSRSLTIERPRRAPGSGREWSGGRGGHTEWDSTTSTPAISSTLQSMKHELTTAREEALARERARIDALKQMRHQGAAALFRDEFVPEALASKLANDLVSSDLRRVHAAMDKLQKQENRLKATELRTSSASELEAAAVSPGRGGSAGSRDHGHTLVLPRRIIFKDAALAVLRDFFTPLARDADDEAAPVPVPRPDTSRMSAAAAAAAAKAAEAAAEANKPPSVGQRWGELHTLGARIAHDFSLWVVEASERMDEEMGPSEEVLEVHCGVNQTLTQYAHLVDEMGNQYVLVSQKDETTVTQDMSLITDVALTLVLAAVASLCASAANLPVIVGYLLAGALVGPGGVSLIHEFIQMESIAQFGVAFLLFHLGAEFDLSAVQAVKAVAVLGGLLQEALTVTFGVLLAVAFGRNISSGVFLGCFLSMASTAIVLRSLQDAKARDKVEGQIMLGILVMQDLSLGFILGVLPVLQSPGSALGGALLHTSAVLAIFALVALGLHVLAMPAVLRAIAAAPQVEVQVLGYVAVCLVFAAISEYLGVSIEMGAFTAGLAISARADRSYAHQALTLVEPIRDVFCAIFFTAIGMLVQPAFLLLHLPKILTMTFTVLGLKFFVVFPSVLLFGYPLHVALLCGAGLSHVGEFAFVLAAKGKRYGLVNQEEYMLLLGTTAVSLLTTPLLVSSVYRSVHKMIPKKTQDWHLQINLPDLPGRRWRLPAVRGRLVAEKRAVAAAAAEVELRGLIAATDPGTDGEGECSGAATPADPSEAWGIVVGSEGGSAAATHERVGRQSSASDTVAMYAQQLIREEGRADRA